MLIHADIILLNNGEILADELNYQTSKEDELNYQTSKEDSNEMVSTTISS